MLDAKFYPSIIDAIWLFMPEDAAIVAGNVCRDWRDRAARVLIRHIALHRRDDRVDEDEVPDERHEGDPDSYRNVTGRVLIKSCKIGSKKTLVLRSLPYRRREIFDWECDDWKYEKEWVDEPLGTEWKKLLARAEVVDAVNWEVEQCQLGELSEALFWSTNEVRHGDDSWPDYMPFEELHDPDDPPEPPLVRWHNSGLHMPHWDLGPREMLFFLDYCRARMIAEIDWWDEEPTGREPHSCQNLTLSIDCYSDPVPEMFIGPAALGPGQRRWSQEVFTVLLFNKTGKKRGKGFKDVGPAPRGLLVNYLETFPNAVFSDVIIVGLEEFFDHKGSLEGYKEHLTRLFKKRAKEQDLRLHPSQFGARLLFRTHRGHKRIVNKNYGPEAYDRHALK